jgi:deoxyribose-phosphate aldolase
MTPDRPAVARMIDHTLLKPEATAGDVERLCVEAVELGVLAVCVSPSMVLTARAALTGSGVLVACVAGFPSGAHLASIKATEAARAVEQGVDEVDMVIDLGAAKAGRWADVEREVALVRSAVPAGQVLKVIIESAALTDDEVQAACHAAVGGGADFVKTSTGFHPTGGATVEAVALMRRTVGLNVGVKASGGIRTSADAVAMLGAGANRIGASASAAILAGLEG